MNSKHIGETTEAIILAKLIQLGYAVSLPFGNNQRYDMIVDKGNGKLLKAQCKTARETNNGSITLTAASTNGFTYKKTSYRGQIDVFYIYCPTTNQVYEVPINVGGNLSITLRIDEPKPGAPTQNIHWAKDFEI